ncbi:alpha/beta hydrolase fold domain-containing protein [Actinocatenispora sera]|jgi:monoterpene epsilon-lactone hydrolase|uniref:Lipase n=1 Tax=Actinocatenispora sera TaxID=390989 RepID=A0A810L3Q8_9ACTN|nr:alpha/beta hydrolase [Actinocatenispora sera]BCJ30013.1 lipase [Actinocatenispora sera]
MPSAEMRGLIERFRVRKRDRAGQPPARLDQAREAFAPAGEIHPIPTDVRVTPVDADGVSAYWLDPPGVATDRVLLFVHGGGFSRGSLRSHGELAARLGRAAGTRVLFGEYRLAPEHPFPAAAEDLGTLWRWLVGSAGVAPGSVALCGDSAGAGLIVGLLARLRDAARHPADPTIAGLAAAAVLLSPHVDLTSSGASIVERANDDPLFTPAMIRGIAAGYLQGADPTEPLASPLFADLHGLPPLLILVGTAEVLFDDARRLAAAARDAGVDVTLTVGDGLPHAYPLLLGTPEAAEATERIAAFLRARLD